MSDRKPPFFWISTLFCHSREGGNPGETISYLDSRLRGNDKKGLSGQTLSNTGEGGRPFPPPYQFLIFPSKIAFPKGMNVNSGG
ncbi:MAG: hypothetical protein P9X24_10435 [Candidatus Hatepunaea meridiana]|nr:hypothetical protein [Candidatus Hatepunaea meridiana]